MRILVIAGFAESLVNFRGSLLAAMAARNLEVHVAAPDLSKAIVLSDLLTSNGFKAHEIHFRPTGVNPVADLYALWGLWKLMSRVKPDVVLGYTIKPVIYGTLAGWLAGVASRYALITGLGYSFIGEARGRRWIIRMVVKTLYCVALRFASKVFFQNPDDEALFRQQGLLRKATPSLVVNGSGVDLDRFSVAPLPSGPQHFLLIARLLGDKGIREYALAAQHIKNVHPHVKFSLVGWIDENPDAVCLSELDYWMKTGTLTYLGRLLDVRPAIARCSVFVLPSYREGTPRTVLEAMAMGRPVITTDAPGCRETVVDGENGFLVPVRSTYGLILAMQRFINDPGLARSMGVRSRKLAEDRYDVHKVNAIMLKEMRLQ